MYDTTINFAGLYGGPAETYPSYLRAHLCGPRLRDRAPNARRFVNQAHYAG
ncbi:hypothetical protein MUNTM_35310 [Mycobacterium sp. MUNTM1]